jgi:hypothetical protein
MIVLIGVPADTPLAMVQAELARRNTPTFLIDQRSVLDTEVQITFGRDVNGIVRVGAASVDIKEVTAVYFRSYGLDQLPATRNLDRGGAQWLHATKVTEAISAWLELSPALIVNRLSAMASNGSKPYQIGLIEKHGFAVPETLVTTDPNCVREFWLRHGTVIYKSISGVRSIVHRLTAEHADRLFMVQWCPTQFQQYIPGKDYRVHVIGEETFGVEITSGADDYRYARRNGLEVSLRPWTVPEDVESRCQDIARSLGLAAAGIDLRYHPAGKWFCFEANPSPAFSYYEQETGQPLAAALARLLLSGSGSRKYVSSASEI